jgi:tetratricopeptide (TPR) repeat protein
MIGHGLLVLFTCLGLAGCSATTAFYMQGHSAMAAGDYDRAAQAFSLALIENPQHVGALTALGMTHYRQEAFDAAIDVLERAQALAPDEPRIRLYQGLADLRQGQVDQARQNLAAFLELNQNRSLAEQTLRTLTVLEEPTLPGSIREYIAYSLEAAFQQEQRVETLRERVQVLEAQRQLPAYPLVFRGARTR